MNDLKFSLKQYKLSSDPHLLDKQNHINAEIHEIIENIHPDVLKGRKYLLKKLPRLIQQYPKAPIFKNLLASVHKERGEVDQAFKINRQLVKEHPDYLFGKLNFAIELLAQKDFEKITALLGNTMELQSLYPERDEFHIEEFISFNQIAVLYFLAQDDIEQAEIRTAMMTEANPDHPKTLHVNEELRHYMLMKVAERKQKEIETYIEPQEKDRRSHLQTTKPPTFNFPLQMQWLYEEDYDFSKNKLQSLLQLKREPLIEDLQKVLHDAIARYDYFMENDEQDETPLFPIHAIFLSCELNAEETVPSIFEILQQDEEFYEVWFGDFINDIVNSIVYVFGEKHLDQFFNFLKKPNLYTYSQTYISEALLQLLKDKPQLRNQLLERYKYLLQFFIDKKDDKNHANNVAYGLIISDVTDAGFKELFPEIEQLFKLNLVAEDICGDLESVEKDIQQKNLINTNNTFFKADIFEKYRLWKEDYENHLEREFGNLDDELPDFHNDTYDFEDEVFDEEAFKRIALYNEDKQPIVKHKEPGRNDPCPCGSGKKYKKCCLN